jgi:AcrR family transcriptional regulator
MGINSVKSSKERAIHVALRQFSTSGDISMRKLADELGVSATALYHHFANKQALLGAVADRAFSDFDKRLRSVKASDAPGTIRDILDGYRQFAADEPWLFGLMFVEPTRSARKFPSDFAAHRSAIFNLLWRAVDDCVTVPTPDDPEESLYLAHDLWALAHGQILLWRAGRFVDEATFRNVSSRAVDRFIETL